MPARKITPPKTSSKWSREDATKARELALRGARGDEDGVQDAMIRMLEANAAPSVAAGYAINAVREERKRTSRREAIAPTTAYDSAHHDSIASPARELEADVPPAPPIAIGAPIDHRAALGAAAASARYIAGVLSTMTAPLLEQASFADEQHLASERELHADTLLWLERLQRLFGEQPTVSPSSAQVALSIETALRLRCPDDDRASWILHCVRVDFPSAKLFDTPQVRELLRVIVPQPRDKALAAAAAALTGARTTASAVKQARLRRSR